MKSNLKIQSLFALGTILFVGSCNSSSSSPTGGTPVVVLGSPEHLTSGERFNCALYDSGQVKCWGQNGSGQLGLGDNENRGQDADEMGDNLPVVSLGSGRTATQISAGNNHVCAVLDNGTVKCWGEGQFGALGQGNMNDLGNDAGEMGNDLVAVNLGTGRTATQVAAGLDYSCALLDNASVKCWGRNGSGQLGQGNSNNVGDADGELGDALTAIDLGTGRTAVQIAAGQRHVCAVLDNGSVKCWGRNGEGQLGQGDTADRGSAGAQMGDSLLAVDLGTGRTATQVATGETHTCALLDDSSMKCWGSGGDGELGSENTLNLGDGVGEMGNDLDPVSVGTGRTVVEITAGGLHTCALLDNDSLKCWGANYDGELGKGNTDVYGDGVGEMGDSLSAVDLGTGRTVVNASFGAYHACAVLDNSDVKCWGFAEEGQLGTGAILSLGNDPGEMGDDLEAIDL